MMAIAPCKMASMWVWYLADPSAPRRVGTISLIPPGKRCSFIYDDAWRKNGFALSPDMPLETDRPIIPPAGHEVPGAIEDAMPAHKGENQTPKDGTPIDEAETAPGACPACGYHPCRCDGGAGGGPGI